MGYSYLPGTRLGVIFQVLFVLTFINSDIRCNMVRKDLTKKYDFLQIANQQCRPIRLWMIHELDDVDVR